MRFHIVTLGCKVNIYETQAIRESLLQNGYTEVVEKDNPDVVIINTCTVTHVASQKSRQKIHHFRRIYPNAILVAVGCYIQSGTYVDTDCDILIGTEGKTCVADKIQEFLKERKKIIVLDHPRERTCYEEIRIHTYKENTRAFVKIQDGCDNFCSYCIIPYVRGKFRSRKKEEILEEIHTLVKNGFSEIVLTGIDTAAYGKDLQSNFTDLIRTILIQEPELKRLRISSIEASQINENFLELLKEEKRIAKHLHIPLQSGSETVLKRMNRKYTKEEFKNKIQQVKNALPSLALACDVIVGFPQESEEEFEESNAFIKECGFHFLHVFPYSIRPNTVAGNMKPQVPSNIKQERVRKLLKIGKELEASYLKQFDNQILEVLFESFDKKKKCWKGYSSNYISVEVKSSACLHGKLRKVRYHYSNISELLDEEKE